MSDSRPGRRRPGARSRSDRPHRPSKRQHAQRAAARQAARAGLDIAITYPAELPVTEHRDEIAEAIRAHQVVIIAGETGSGKTTQIPKICLELGYGITGLIGHTQPRRIAARAVAARLADELGQELGAGIGYQVRFTSQVADATRVKVMTDGILLAELQHDRKLRDYEVIIIDEAHERSLNIDFLLGSLARLLPTRPDLKVIITSATIDPESFAEHFASADGPAPIISVSGRTYPVEVRYRPLVDDTASDDDPDGPGADGDYEAGAADQTEGVLAAVDELAREAPGDILVFLSGEREIRDTADALAAHLQQKGPRFAGWEVIPLFARLSAGEQQRVFAPHDRPRIVLATNVAETSLTVPGIKYVIDAGTARISRYSNRTKVQRLPIERVSQASANQRMGRCGRTSEGICIRLYSEDDFDTRPEFTDPEILRTNLASVILQMISLGFAQTEADITSFPFLTPPESKAVRDGRVLLGELGATRTDETGRIRLTKIGRMLAKLPIDPRLARMVLAGAEAGCGGEVAVIVAGLSVQDPRERPAEVRAQADELHARFTDPHSDFLTLLNLWNHLADNAAALSSSKFRKLCKAEFINFVRVREWQDLVTQLRHLLGGVGVKIDRSHWRPGSDEQEPARSQTGSRSRGGGRSQADGRPRGGGRDGKKGSAGAPEGMDPHAAAIHRALLTGLLSMIGVRTPEPKPRPGERRPKRRGYDYQGARGTKFQIFPGSGLFKSAPEVVVAAELVETSRLWARMVAAVEPEWIVEAAGDLVTRQHSEPHWSKKGGQAMAYERISLYGVTLISDQRIGYGRIDPEAARDMFIRHALIDGEWNDRHPFLARNAKAIDEAERLASRMRDHRLLAEDDVLFDFYDDRLPATIISGAHFNSWWKKKRRSEPELLDIDPEALLADDSADMSARAASDFPLTWALPDGSEAKLHYAYAPGQATDGVTVELPAEALADVDTDVFTWQVPGLRHELVTALIRSLPKAKRRYFVPAPDVATDILDVLEPYAGRLPEVLAAELTARAGGGELTDLVPITVEASDFDTDRLPAHLVMEFTTRQGKKTSQPTRDPSQLTTSAAAPKPAEKAAQKTTFTERTGIRDWDFTLDTRPVPTGSETEVHPGLRDDRDSVAITAFATAEEAARRTRAGLIRLLVIALKSRTDYIAEHLSTNEKLVLAGHAKTGFGAANPQTRPDLLSSCARIAVDRLLGSDTTARTRDEFDTVFRQVDAGFITEATRAVSLVVDILTRATAVDKAISAASSLILVQQLADVRSWLIDLMSADVFEITGAGALARFPVYLQAAEHRVAKMQESPARDRQLMDRISVVAGKVEQALTKAFPNLADLPVPVQAAGVPADWAAVLWSVEELRISYFAQHLPTAHPVSDPRIHKALAAL